MDDLRQAAQAALGLLTSPYVTSDDWSKVRDMLRAALAQPEHSMTHVDIARNVLTHLGRSISPSREPGADEHVDRLAAKLAEWLAQPEPQPTSWRPIETAPNDEAILIYQQKFKRVALAINDGFGWKHATHWMPLPAAPGAAAQPQQESSNG